MSRAWIAAQLGKDGPVPGDVPKDVLREACRLIAHAEFCLPSVKVPSMWIQSRHDEWVPHLRLRDAEPKTEVPRRGDVVLERSGRRITLDSDCDLAAFKTAQFVNEVGRNIGVRSA